MEHHRFAAALFMMGLTAIQPARSSELTVYEGDFAVVCETVAVDVTAGSNRVTVTDVPAAMEAYSLMVNPQGGAGQVRVLEQDYPGRVATPELLLALYEGSTIPFAVGASGETHNVEGKIMRAPRAGMPPIIEVAGSLCFDLPGKPQFPKLPDGVAPKPTLTLALDVGQAGHTDLELNYITRALTWQADYNAVLSEEGTLELDGWLTVTNSSGKDFAEARIQLAAVTERPDRPARLSSEGYPQGDPYQTQAYAAYAAGKGPRPSAPLPSLPTDYTYYPIAGTLRLGDGEPTRVEFAHSRGVHPTLAYVYDGWKAPASPRQDPYSDGNLRNRNYGTESRREVGLMNELANTPESGLGAALPPGRLHAYRRGKEGLTFLGDDRIGPIPANGKVTLFAGAAPGLTGTRSQTNFQDDPQAAALNESFEIAVKNDGPLEAVVRIVEHLYRGRKWDIADSSDPYQKQPDGTIEFRVQVKPAEEKKVTYTVRYTW